MPLKKFLLKYLIIECVKLRYNNDYQCIKNNNLQYFPTVPKHLNKYNNTIHCIINYTPSIKIYPMNIKFSNLAEI
jgi:hypothetical protein